MHTSINRRPASRRELAAELDLLEQEAEEEAEEEHASFWPELAGNYDYDYDCVYDDSNYSGGCDLVDYDDYDDYDDYVDCAAQLPLTAIEAEALLSFVPKGVLLFVDIGYPGVIYAGHKSRMRRLDASGGMACPISRRHAKRLLMIGEEDMHRPWVLDMDLDV